MTDKKSKPLDDSGAAEVQERMDAITAQGFVGTKTDPTPNENYSLQTPPDAPTPETDAKLAEQTGSPRAAALRANEQREKFAGVEEEPAQP